MIIRPHDRSQFLITQPDHAALAGHVMRHWQADGLPIAPRRDAILLAIDAHDDGWREVDAAPIVDVDSGRLLDFVTVPYEVRSGVWPRAVSRLTSTPYSAALVAQHALHIYRRFREDETWTAFFDEMEAARNHHLAAASPGSPEDLLRDYSFLRLGDLISLTFCNGWTDVQEEFDYAIRLDGSRIVISPDPFDGHVVPVEIRARLLPNRPFASAEEARSAFEHADVVTLTGRVMGSSAG